MSAAGSTVIAILLVGQLTWASGSGNVVAQEVASAPLQVVTRVYNKQQLLHSAALTRETLQGRALWLQRCAYCHDGVGQPTYKTMGPWIGAETVQLLGEDALRAIVGAGTARMPGFRYTLEPQQVNQLIAFLKTVQSDQKPTPEQLAARSSGAARAGSDE
jgi:mono/diheme cytochrome c family protein